MCAVASGLLGGTKVAILRGMVVDTACLDSRGAQEVQPVLSTDDVGRRRGIGAGLLRRRVPPGSVMPGYEDEP